MSISDYIRRLIRRWRVIVLVLLGVLGLAVGFTALQQPTYESNAQIYISVSGDEEDISTAIGNQLIAQQRVLSYAAVADSQKMSAAIIDDLGLTSTPAQVSSQITATVEFGTVLVDVVVTGSTPQEAFDIANSLLLNYNNVLAQVENTTATGLSVGVSTLREPTLSERAVSPNVLLNLIAGFFTGLIMGIAGAALRDLVDNSIKEAVDIEEVGGSMLGRIPVRSAKMANKLTGPDDSDPSAESLRQTRANLQFASLDSAPRSIVVTSSIPAEGKSFVAANLAAVYAAAGYDVVLVDADLRRPVQARRLNRDGSVGLTTALTQNIAISQAVQETVLPGLWVLTSGALPPNPAEVLGSQAMSDLVEELKTVCDVVIFDTPPILPFADARALLPHADGVVLVTSHGKTRKSDLEASMEAVSQSSARLLGVLLNRAPKSRSMTYYYADYATTVATKPKA